MVGIILQSPEGDVVECAVRLQLQTTNNKVEYEALLVGIDLANAIRASSIVIHYDSQVVVGQVNGDHEEKGECMKKYMHLVKQHVGQSLEAKFVQIPRELSFIPCAPTMDQIEVQVILLGDDWMTPCISYLKDGQLPDDQGSTRKLKVWASYFVLIRDILYKKGFSLSYLRCLALSEANYVLREVYEGICGNHARAYSLTQKLIRTRYY